MAKVAVIETEVYGAKAYHCKCLDCAWQSKRFDEEMTAIRKAKNHVCGKLTYVTGMRIY